MTNPLTNSTILITGGTGSFGNTFVPMTLLKHKPKKIIVFSRDEMKQWEMAKLFNNDERVRFFIGDVRDKDRLHRALDGVDYVVHAAATKIVPTAEYNPFECIKTNINGAMNLIDASIDRKIKKVVALSTDKASSPINLYGATKLCSDKLFVSANNIIGNKNILFSVVRYGNVTNSRGSVIPIFKRDSKKGLLKVTDGEMTRFNISLEEGVEFVLFALENSLGQEIFVPKLKSYNILDLAKAVSSKAKIKIVGIREGEKVHEEMITTSDSYNTLESKNFYIVLPTNIENKKKYIKKFKSKVIKKPFSYNSKDNLDKLKISDLKKII